MIPSKKKKEKKMKEGNTTSDVNVVKYASAGVNLHDRRVRAVAEKVANARIEKRARENAAALVNAYLDKVASSMHPAQQAPLRRVQAALGDGKDIFTAIAAGFPKMAAERRGVTARSMVKGATDFYRAQQKKQANIFQGYGGGSGSSVGTGDFGGEGGAAAPANAPAGGIIQASSYTGKPKDAMGKAKESIGY